MLEVREQPPRLGERVGGDPGQVGEHRVAHRVRREGQQRLADPGRVHRQAATDLADHRHRGVPHQPVHVEHLGALPHGEVHGGARGGIDVVQERRGHRLQVRGTRRQQPDVPQPPPDDVLPRGEPHETAPGDQLGHQPVGRGQRQPGAPGQLAEGQAAVVEVEGVEQREDARGHAGPGSGAVAGHVPSLPLSENTVFHDAPGAP